MQWENVSHYLMECTQSFNKTEGLSVQNKLSEGNNRMWRELSVCKQQVCSEAFQCGGRFSQQGNSPGSNNFSGKFHQLFLEGVVDTFAQACSDNRRGDNVPATPFPEISPPLLQKSRGYYRKTANWDALASTESKMSKGMQWVQQWI